MLEKNKPKIILNNLQQDININEQEFEMVMNNTELAIDDIIKQFNQHIGKNSYRLMYLNLRTRSSKVLSIMEANLETVNRILLDTMDKSCSKTVNQELVSKIRNILALVINRARLYQKIISIELQCESLAMKEHYSINLDDEELNVLKICNKYWKGVEKDVSLLKQLNKRIFKVLLSATGRLAGRYNTAIASINNVIDKLILYAKDSLELKTKNTSKIVDSIKNYKNTLTLKSCRNYLYMQVRKITPQTYYLLS